MKRLLHTFGKFYSRVMMKFIGIFIFVGILMVVFGEHGWMPNKDIYAISQFVYAFVIPILIAYTSGSLHQEGTAENNVGGVLAVMAVTGMLNANSEIGIMGALILAPLCGLLWRRGLEPLLNHWNSSADMLVRNLVIAGSGSILAILSYYVLTPTIVDISQMLMMGISYLVKHRLIFLLSFLIEPIKVLFLNNSIHHGILLPLAMQQAEQAGDSILFLLETNPGPGLGILLALYIKRTKKRKEYAASIFAEFIGGIHEVYFPEALANVWLFLPLVAGGTVGNLCFSFLDVAAVTAISPGSIITFLLVCNKNKIVGAFIGVVLSVLTSLFLAISILCIQEKWKKRNRTCVKVKEEPVLEEEKRIEVPSIKEGGTMKEKVGFICDAGVGSSAMAAALFRRKLQELQIGEVEVSAYAVDQVPTDLTLAVCQKDFRELLLGELSDTQIVVVESLLNQTELTRIAEEIKQRREMYS